MIDDSRIRIHPNQLIYQQPLPSETASRPFISEQLHHATAPSFPTKGHPEGYHLQKESSESSTDDTERGDDTAGTSGGDGAGGRSGVARSRDGANGRGGQGDHGSGIRSRSSGRVAGSRAGLNRVGWGSGAGAGDRVGRVAAAGRVAGRSLNWVGWGSRAGRLNRVGWGLNRIAGSLNGVAGGLDRVGSNGSAGRVDLGSLNGIAGSSAGLNGVARSRAGLDRVAGSRARRLDWVATSNGITTSDGVSAVLGGGKASQGKGDSSSTHFDCLGWFKSIRYYLRCVEKDGY
jgi:hypothetical protein